MPANVGMVPLSDDGTVPAELAYKAFVTSFQQLTVAE
jgi:hypothetical protein